MKYYAGIGARDTPVKVLEVMNKIAAFLSKKNYILRSGGAKGADSAFEQFATKKEIFKSQDATPEAIEIALRFHPNPTALIRKGQYVVGLMGRNIQILSGYNLDQDVDFVVCWTSDGTAKGGTGQAIRYAESKGIKIYNIYDKEQLDQLREFCKTL